MSEDRGRGSDLPAEYVDPWRLLRRDLGAVLASLRLRLWELWRRNREGELWRPEVWPSSLAPLFWPLALTLLLLLAGIGGGVLRQRLTTLPPATLPPAPLPPATEPQRASSPPAASPRVETPAIDSAAAAIEEEALEEAATTAPPAPSLPPAPMEAPAPAAAPDPLLSALGEPGEPALLEAARAEPALGLLVVRATPAYMALAREPRRERAEVWEHKGQELGYEQLEVRGPRGTLLARSARVGNGLVLFDPPADRADADPA